MTTITNPRAILNGYNIEFPTKRYIDSNFNINITNADENAFGNPRLLPKTKSDTVFSMIPDLVGFDVPVLVKSSCPENKGTVVILGQDALRDPKDPLLNGINTNTDIVVGLPYAIAFDQDYKQVADYHNLIKAILDGGYDVYLTDIWKSWDKDHISRLGKWSKKNPHQKSLLDELNAINADFVILMGNEAKNKYASIKPSTPPVQIHIPHLSPANNGTWAKILGSKPITFQNKIGHIRKECNKQGLVF